MTRRSSQLGGASWCGGRWGLDPGSSFSFIKRGMAERRASSQPLIENLDSIAPQAPPPISWPAWVGVGGGGWTRGWRRVHLSSEKIRRFRTKERALHKAKCIQYKASSLILSFLLFLVPECPFYYTVMMIRASRVFLGVGDIFSLGEMKGWQFYNDPPFFVGGKNLLTCEIHVNQW